MIVPLEILFEDAHLLAVSKPAGLLTQGRPGGEPTLEESVRLHVGRASSSSVYLGTVHRLDRPVSGVMVWAKTEKAARRLAAQFAAHQARKEYWAIVAGELSDTGDPGDAGAWEDWLSQPDSLGAARSVSPETPGARRALTRFLRESDAQTPQGSLWLRLWPETGRTHQLRAQAAARGLPILGDIPYGSTRPFAGGIALHARRLNVRHPILHCEIELVAPLPGHWKAQGIVLPVSTSSGR